MSLQNWFDAALHRDDGVNPPVNTQETEGKQMDFGKLSVRKVWRLVEIRLNEQDKADFEDFTAGLKE